MKAFLKATRLSLLLVLLCSTTRAQREFIDSIRNMLVDLDEQIQNAPINQLLQHTIPYCTGDTMNDSLIVRLKQLISDECIFQRGLLQPVSGHLFKKYGLFIFRIATFFVQAGTPDEYNQDMLRVAIVKIMLAAPLDTPEILKEAGKILSQLQFEDSFYKARVLFYLAATHGNSNPDSAFILYKHSLSQNPKKTTEEKMFYEESLFASAEFCRTHNRKDTALLLLRELLRSVKAIYDENSADYALWLLRMADSYTYMAKYDPALELAFKAEAITGNALGKETNQYALCLMAIGEIYYRKGEYGKSLPYTKQALDIKRRIFGNDYFDNVINLHDLATLYTRMGLYNEAIPLLNESLAISKKYFGEEIVYAFDVHPLAEVYENLGEYDKALPLYQKALRLQTKGANFYYPRTLHSIASLFTKLGQYDKAIDLFKETLKLKKEAFGELNPEYTKTLTSYAQACVLKGDYKNALSLQLQALSLNKKLFGDTHPNIAAGYYNLSTLYYEQKDLQKAEAFCNQSLRLQKEILGQNHPDVASSYDMLGNINRQLHRYDSAFEYYQKAFEIRKNIMNTVHPDYTQSLYNLATIYIKKRQFSEATQFLIRADSAALQHIEASYSSLSEEEKLIYLHNREKQFQYLPSLLYLRKTTGPEIVNHVYSDAIALKSMVLFHQQQVYNSIRKSGDSVALQVYNQWRYNKAFLGQQILLPPAKRLHGFDSLRDITTQMEGRLSQISSTFRNNFLNYDAGVDAIIQHLSKNEAVVEFIRFRLYNNTWTDSIIYAAIVLLPGKSYATFVPLFEENELKKLMQFSNNSGEAAVNYSYPPVNIGTTISNKLYRILWRPVEKLLDSVHTVYYSPCGLLFRISFAAVHTNDNKLLIEKYNLRQLLSTRSLAWPAERKTDFEAASLWGGIDYNVTITTTPTHLSNGHNTTNSFAFSSAYERNTSTKGYSPGAWQPLPGTKTETSKILLLLKEKNITSKLDSGTAASEEEFKKMDGASPGLIHIATHGFFLPPATNIKRNKDFLYETNSFTGQVNPMLRSGLVLAGANRTWTGNTSIQGKEDGVLTAYEISQLDLSNTQLITLSACETALGDIEDNEGVYGLQRAFKMAGVKQVLMSLWKVPDMQSIQLMEQFYASILQGNDANTSLRSAQLAMKKKYPPYYWAGFILSE